MAKTIWTSSDIETGTFLPSISDFVLQDNISSITLTYGDFNYIKIGNMITVSGVMAIQATTPSVSATLYMPLPFTGNISYVSEVGGVGSNTLGESWALYGGTGIEQVVMKSTPSSTTNLITSFTYTYYLHG